MTTVYKYRLWCIEEATYVYTYGTQAPTLCPNNHTDRSINPASTTAIEIISNETHAITQEIPGYYQMSTTTITVPSGATGSIYEQTFSFPMDIQLWVMEFTSTSAMVGDSFSIIAAPETIIGAVTAPVSTTDTVLNINNTFFTSELIAKGLEVMLFDGVNTDLLGLIVGHDAKNLQITVQNSPSISYAPGSYIKFNTYIVKNQHIDASNKTFVFGRKGITTKLIQANTPLKFVYTNNTGTAKNLYFNLEYNYY